MRSPPAALACLIILGCSAGCAITSALAQSVDGDLAQPGPGAALTTDTQRAVLAAIGQAEFDRARAILRGARNRGLPLGRYHLLQAKVYAAERDRKAEEQQLHSAIYRDPTLTEAYLRLAAITEGRGLWLEAADLYRRAIKSDPIAVQPYLHLARVLLEKERYKKAVEVLEDARVAAPQDAAVFVALAGAYEQMGEIGRAVTNYRAAAALADGRLRTRALLKAAKLSMAAGDHMAALAYYRQAGLSGQRMSDEVYCSAAAAADVAAWQVFRPAWVQFEAYADGLVAAPEREDAYEIIAVASVREREIKAFINGLPAPKGFKGEHAQRRYQFSLLYETLTNAMAYLDTGDTALLAAGRARRLDALSVGQMLSGPPQTPPQEPS